VTRTLLDLAKLWVELVVQKTHLKKPATAAENGATEPQRTE
jgi:hypothetical protein